MELLKHCIPIFSPPRLAALPDRQATFVLYKLAVNQPSPQWSLFLRVRYSTLTVNIPRYTVNIRNLKRHFCRLPLCCHCGVSSYRNNPICDRPSNAIYGP